MSIEATEIQQRVNLLVSSSPPLVDNLHGFSFVHTSADMCSKRIVTVVGRLDQETQRSNIWLVERRDEWWQQPVEQFRLLRPPFMEFRTPSGWELVKPEQATSLADELWYINSPTSRYKTEKIENYLAYAALLEQFQEEVPVATQLLAAS